MTPFCLARMPDWGPNREALRSVRPDVGIARRSDLSRCDRRHLAQDDRWDMPPSPRTP
jgi:hypothetical protein